MTVRFSPEYIEFVTNSKCIQALWKPGAGDWFVTSDGASLWLVTAVIDGDIEALNTTRQYSYPYRPDHFFQDEQAGVGWLPTLDDLVEELEKVGPQEYIDLHYDVLPPRPDKYWAWQGQPLRAGKRDRGDSWKLAAARLLERVLEEGQCT